MENLNFSVSPFPRVQSFLANNFPSIVVMLTRGCSLGYSIVKKNRKTVLAEYIWIDGYGGTRSKARVLETDLVDNVKEVPEWSFDSSSTGQGTARTSDALLIPRSIFKDPFRKGNNILVLAETYCADGSPHKTNSRATAEKLFKTAPELEPWFGIEQEFFLMKKGIPIAFAKDNGLLHEPQKYYYCGTGGEYIHGRECVEEMVKAGLHAGIGLTGLNGEVAPAQWEYQVLGEGIEAADQLTVMRWISSRVAEKYGWDVDLSPKPIKGDWNGSGAHVNFSTKPMREEGGLKVIEKAISSLEKRHLEHISIYGSGNKDRLKGTHETSSWKEFSHDKYNRGTSIRISPETVKKGKGYFEDRRPASSMDPYLVTSAIFHTTSIGKQTEWPFRRFASEDFKEVLKMP